MVRSASMTKTGFCVVLLLLLGSLLPGSEIHAQAKKKPSTPASMEEPNSILLMSVPSGLRVYLSPDTANPGSARDKDVGLGMNHPTITEKHLKGTTPVLVRNVKPGNYLLGVAPIRIVDREHRVADIDRMMITRGIVSHVPLQELPRWRKEVMGAAVYAVTKEGTGPRHILVLAVHPTTSLSKLDSLYPAESLFPFDENAYLEELRSRQDVPMNFFTGEEQLQLVKLLRRGGKVVYGKGDFMFLSEIAGDGTWTIKTALHGRGRE